MRLFLIFLIYFGSSHGNDVEDFDTRWYGVLLLVREVP